MRRWEITLKAYGMVRRVVVEAEDARQAKIEAERGTSIGSAIKVRKLS